METKQLFLPIAFSFLLLNILPQSAFSQSRENNEREREERRTNNRHANIQPTGPQVTQEIIQVPAPAVINFQQLADYEAAHPSVRPPKFIAQIEDRDEDFSQKLLPIEPGAPVFNIPESNTQNQHGPIRESPAPTGSWNGVMDNSTLIPPDIRGAASSGNYVMETTNQEFKIYNKTGTLLSTLSIDNFFSASQGSGFFDPHVVFDHNYNRFIAVIDGNANNGNSGLAVAVSQTNDPTGSWYVYGFDAIGNGSDFLDFPLLGFNENWVVVTGVDFLNNGNTYEKIYVMNRANLYSGSLGTVTTFTDNNANVIAPAETRDAGQTVEYLVQDANGNSGGSGYVKIGSIKGTPSTPVYNAGSNVGVTQPWSESTFSAPQLGSTNKLEASDTRMGNAVMVGGSLYFTHTVGMPANSATHDAVDWWQVEPLSLTVQQFGRLNDASNSIYYYYPSINANSNGDILLGYCTSSSSAYTSAAFSFHAYTDAANTMQSTNIYKPGIAGYYKTLGGGRNRWGDYTMTAVDPSDQSFWNFGQWANSGNKWGTVIAHIPASVPPTNPPVANFAAVSTFSSCTGNIQFNDLSTNTPSQWLWNFGDGATATTQNPNHTYLTNGTYTVSLTATNQYGGNTKTLTSYITISKPGAPTANNVTRCGSGTVSLSAATSNPVAWLDSAGNVVSSANPFVTPSLGASRTYWVMDTTAGNLDSVGPKTNTELGGGGYFANTNIHYEIFDCYQACKLVSVTVYAGSAGTRTIQLRNSSGTVLQSVSPSLVAGTNIVTLNFNIPAGTGYQIATSSTTTNVDLYRNSAVPTNGYPFTLGGLLSITGSDAGSGYYYYYYNWKVQATGCISETRAVTAVIGPAFSGGNISATNPSCSGSTNGTATASATGGTPGYTYLWSNGQTTATLSNLGAINVNVTITDAVGCSVTAVKTLTAPTAINVSVTPTNAGCSTANGSAAASVSGGTAGYTYHWNNNATTSTITGLAGGTYLLTVTDSHSCTATATTTVAQAGGISLTPTSSNVNCFGSSTGSAGVTVSGSTGTLSYLWNTGATTSSISNQPAGNYTVTVTQTGGCSATATQTITQPTALLATATPVNVGCGSSTGSVSASVTGGTATYNYLWSNGATTAALSSVVAGGYSVTVTDAHGCTTTAAATVSNTGGQITLTPSGTNVNCNGAATGSASVSVSGSGGNLSYVWSNAATTQSITGITAGTYTVTVTQTGGCTGTATQTITQPTPINAAVTTSNAGCGSANGSAAANVTGGTAGYTYLWSTNATTSSITGVSAGNYPLTVTDAHGCTASAVAIVNNASTLVSNQNSVNTSCFGSSNGSASVTVTSGTSPFTYLWNTGATTSAINNVVAGSYLVTITDGAGCQRVETVVVGQPTAIAISITPTDATCAGYTNGKAHATISGGEPGYTYLWSNSATTNALNNVAAGVYTLTVHDDNGCSSTSTINVNEPAAVAFTVNTQNVNCNGEQTGSLHLNATGGTPGYTYLWSNSNLSADNDSLGAGSYAFTITDSHDCSVTAFASVSQPAAITVYTSSTLASNGNSDGSATVDSISGGTAPYHIVRWNDGQTNNTAQALTAGTYTVTVADSHGCEQTATVVVNSATGLTNLKAELDFNLYPNPANQSVTVTFNNVKGEETYITVYDLVGQALAVIPMQGNTLELNLQGFASGVYMLELSQYRRAGIKKLIIAR